MLYRTDFSRYRMFIFSIGTENFHVVAFGLENTLFFLTVTHQQIAFTQIFMLIDFVKNAV